MDSVERHLLTKYGPALFLPAYREPDPKLGIISRFAPGTKENGTVFNHPVAWAIMAECILGRGDRAYELWKTTSFITRGREPEVYKAEPYAYCEYVHGPDSVNYGQGEFSWLTGTAAWMWKVCMDWILGVRPELRGLLVDPCIPSAWDGYSLTRRFRRATYEIEVTNPDHVSTGIAEITVDGEKWESHLLPVFSDGRTHVVTVRMGAPAAEIEVPAELISQRAPG
jgi:cellobiose phosphorylase